MIRASTACGLFAFLTIAHLSAQSANAHGSVTPDEDLCRIKIGYFSAHFKIYLPVTRRHEQFCEDLPEAGHSVFVMEYEHRQLEEAPIDFRIIRNATGQGRFTRLEDVARIGDLDAVTVFHHPPAVQRDVFTAQHRFEGPGEFVGIVTATRPDTGKTYNAVFPFEVGFTGFGYWPWLLVAVLLLQWQYWWLGRARRRRKTVLTVGPLLLLALPPLPAEAGADAPESDEVLVSRDGHYRLRYSSRLEPVVINRIHSWVLHLETAGGAALQAAQITVDGGMPGHDHGLPTRPLVTESLGHGDFLLEGLRFHMNGYWEIQVTIDAGAGRDTVIIPLELPAGEAAAPSCDDCRER